MQTPRIAELAYPTDVAPLFRTLADLPWPVWLDSAARGVDSSGRYDVLVADPYVTLRTRGAVTEVATRGGERIVIFIITSKTELNKSVRNV